MAHPSIIINGVVYSAVPEVDVPQSGGGTARFFDASQADVSAADVRAGKIFLGPNGEDTGSMADNGATGGTISTKAGSIVIPAGITSGGNVSISAAEQAKIIPANIKSGVTILGVAGTLSLPSISQDNTTMVLFIA